MDEKDYLNHIKDQLISSIGQFCSMYTRPTFMNKCKMLICHLILKDCRLFTSYSIPEMSASTIYAAGESENSSIISGMMQDEPGLIFISNYYNVSDYTVYSITRIIKRLLLVDTSHPFGLPDYTLTYPKITVLGIGEDGTKSAKMIKNLGMDSQSYINICTTLSSKEDMEINRTIILRSDTNGSIAPECILELEYTAASADILFILVNPDKIGGLEGQALGVLVRSYALRICVLLGGIEHNTLTVKLLKNGMDVMLSCNINESDFFIISKLLNSLGRFSIGRDNLSIIDFFNAKMLLKNAGDCKIGYGRATGNNRCNNALIQCIGDKDLSKIKKAFVNITGPMDLGVTEIGSVVQQISRLSKEKVEILYSSTTNCETINYVELICIFS